MTKSNDIVPLSGAALKWDNVSPDTVGAKGFNLMRIARAGMVVPPGFVLGTALCRQYLDSNETLPEGFKKALDAEVQTLESATGKFFGGARRPLLLSVRSGSAQSMPGMLETVLNIGLNDQALTGLIRATGNPRLAWDSYRRLIAQYAEVVFGCSPAPFDQILHNQRDTDGLSPDEPLDWEGYCSVAWASLDQFHALTGRDFPQDPMDQLIGAIEAVFKSWNIDKAKQYRRLNNIDDGAATAATVQAMVFGNAGATSGAGVCFTRNPATGENQLYMDFMFDAQGEDVVSGRFAAQDARLLQQAMPETYAEIEQIRTALEMEFHDLQDFEFTIEDGVFYLLQSRAGKRSPWAALRIAVDLVHEGLITPSTALTRLKGIDLDGLQRICLSSASSMAPLATATPASANVAAGAIATSLEKVRSLTDAGKPVIFVREDFDTADIVGISKAEGILTATGSRTSHAAVVARGLGKVCLVGCANLNVLPDGRCSINGRTFNEGTMLTLDGENGAVFEGKMEIVTERPTEALEEVARWRKSTHNGHDGHKP